MEEEAEVRATTSVKGLQVDMIWARETAGGPLKFSGFEWRPDAHDRTFPVKLSIRDTSDAIIWSGWLAKPAGQLWLLSPHLTDTLRVWVVESGDEEGLHGSAVTVEPLRIRAGRAVLKGGRYWTRTPVNAVSGVPLGPPRVIRLVGAVASTWGVPLTEAHIAAAHTAAQPPQPHVRWWGSPVCLACAIPLGHADALNFTCDATPSERDAAKTAKAQAKWCIYIANYGGGSGPHAGEAVVDKAALAEGISTLLGEHFKNHAKTWLATSAMQHAEKNLLYTLLYVDQGPLKAPYGGWGWDLGLLPEPPPHEPPPLDPSALPKSTPKSMPPAFVEATRLDMATWVRTVKLAEAPISVTLAGVEAPATIHVHHTYVHPHPQPALITGSGDGWSARFVEVGGAGGAPPTMVTVPLNKLRVRTSTTLPALLAITHPVHGERVIEVPAHDYAGVVKTLAKTVKASKGTVMDDFTLMAPKKGPNMQQIPPPWMPDMPAWKHDSWDSWVMDLGGGPVEPLKVGAPPPPPPAEPPKGPTETHKRLVVVTQAVYAAGVLHVTVLPVKPEQAGPVKFPLTISAPMGTLTGQTRIRAMLKALGMLHDNNALISLNPATLIARMGWIRVEISDQLPPLTWWCVHG